MHPAALRLVLWASLAALTQYMLTLIHPDFLGTVGVLGSQYSSPLLPLGNLSKLEASQALSTARRGGAHLQS